MRNRYFDVLKAVAIIAVVLYHIGICEFGYLGVDIFLVIAGYFTSKSIDSQIINGGGIYHLCQIGSFVFGHCCFLLVLCVCALAGL